MKWFTKQALPIDRNIRSNFLSFISLGPLFPALLRSHRRDADHAWIQLVESGDRRCFESLALQNLPDRE